MRIELDGVGWRQHRYHALADINLQWEGPGVYVVTGSPGAGKSTFLRIMAGLTSCEGSINREYQGCGYLPQVFSFYPNLTPIEFFDYLLILEGLADSRLRARTIQAVIARTDLDRQARQRMGSLPSSARQRVAIIQSLINNPECLVWDTPEQNLRAAGQEWLFATIDKERTQRMLVIATDHIGIYEMLATRIAVLHDGKMLFEGSREQLLATTQGQVWEGKIPFKQWHKFRLEHMVCQADIVDGGIMTRILGSCKQDYPDFQPATGTVEDAVELLIQAASHRMGVDSKGERSKYVSEKLGKRRSMRG